MSSFFYFAYGSNMLLERLVARCPSARRLGIVIAGGHTVDFSKRGADGSGKAALVRHAKRSTFGVLFEIALSERDALDRYEGPGYQRVDAFQVLAVSGFELVSVSTYLPCASEPDLMPYDWYLQLVVAGCEQSLFPGAYTDRLRRIAFMADPEPARCSAREARTILSRHGTAMGRAGANGTA